MANKQQLPAKGKSRGKGKKFDRYVTAGIILAIVVIGFVLWGPFMKSRHPAEKKPAQQAQKTEGAAGKQAVPGKKTDKKKAAESGADREAKEALKRDFVSADRSLEKKAAVAIVIDDLGQDLKPAQELAALPYRITFAVMPGLSQSKKVA
jgi:hypothetical protein